MDVANHLRVVGVAVLLETLLFEVEEKSLHHCVVPAIALGYTCHWLDKYDGLRIQCGT